MAQIIQFQKLQIQILNPYARLITYLGFHLIIL
nr:MAG TPA: hypothetical protein [Caudoviricetes sp.]